MKFQKESTVCSILISLRSISVKEQAFQHWRSMSSMVPGLASTPLLKFKIRVNQIYQHHAAQRQVEPSSCGKIHILYRKKKWRYIFNLKLFNYLMICLNLKSYNYLCIWFLSNLKNYKYLCIWFWSSQICLLCIYWFSSKLLTLRLSFERI